MTASENQRVVYQPNETVRLDVRRENETVWLAQLKIAEMFWEPIASQLQNLAFYEVFGEKYEAILAEMNIELVA